MSEINGLRVIYEEAVKRGCLHVVKSAPERASFGSYEEFAVAYKDWWDSQHLWAGTVISTED